MTHIYTSNEDGNVELGVHISNQIEDILKKARSKVTRINGRV